MRLALVSAHFPPDNCGVGDYTARLAAELLAQGHTTSVWTAQQAPAPFPGEIRRHPYPWSFARLAAMARDLADWKPEAIIVQYAPNLIAPEWYGVHPGFPLWIALLKARTKALLAVNAHELNFPVELSAKGLALGVPQYFQIRAAIAASDRVFFTYDAALERCASALPWRAERFSRLPVGSNIQPAAGASDSRLSALENKRVFVHFGGSHPTNLFSQIFSALEQALANFGPGSTVLALPGIDAARADSLLAADNRAHLRQHVVPLGYVSAGEASAWLARADLVLAPFLDGVSTRRGSVMAALAHAAPVVTTKGWASSPRVPWNDFCAISAPADFARESVELLSQPAKAKDVGLRGREYYSSHFDWPVIAREMVGKLQ